MPVLFNFQEEKTTEAAGILLQLSDGKMPYISLIKLLYYADREALRQIERPITYDFYYSMKNGPILSNTYDIIRQKNPIAGGYWNQYIVTKGLMVILKEAIKRRKISDAEYALLISVYEKYGRLNKWDLVESTHELPEHKNPEPITSSRPIPLADVLSALEYSQEDIHRITSEIIEEEHVQAVFGV